MFSNFDIRYNHKKAIMIWKPKVYSFLRMYYENTNFFNSYFDDI